MRSYIVFVLLLVSLHAPAQPAPIASYDTATINFMRWKLAAARLGTSIRRLHDQPVYWSVAELGGISVFPGDTSLMYQYGHGSDTSRLFKYRLFLLHSADTTIYSPAQLAGFRGEWRRLFCTVRFNSADLRQMEATYRRRKLPRWPAFPGVHRIRPSKRKQPYYAYTLPLFSADYNRVVIWEHRFWITGESGTLLTYRRKPGGGWEKECPLQSWGFDE
ncbi:hypothetical protein [Hymenobacter pini]|uniref:hypothetical protein n=1 Tax=Hymenobacter pini TaxID=2880879 RepID=UPI001CF5F532|nr:hypothetical protein [Hymenobacter pini]MCA8832242.1 hypothetical protein [Hymenobacter pini]